MTRWEICLHNLAVMHAKAMRTKLRTQSQNRLRARKAGVALAPNVGGKRPKVGLSDGLGGC
jgi:hypothetical protein